MILSVKWRAINDQYGTHLPVICLKIKRINSLPLFQHFNALIAMCGLLEKLLEDFLWLHLFLSIQFFL